MSPAAEETDRSDAAGEYVLGVLSEPDRIAFEAAMAQDAALRAEVYAWQDRLLGLTAQAPAAAPSAALWQRIAFESAAMDAAVAAADADERSRARSAATSPSEAAASRSASGQRLPWWQRLVWWQGISGAAVAASLVLAVMLAARLGTPDAGGARYLAMLQSPVDRSTGWVVEMQAGRTLRLVAVGPGATTPVPPGRALQFWTKAQGATGPTSLGLVRAGQPLSLPVSALPAVEAQQLFEITLEPENGSPIGRPTGPILYVGRAVAL